MPRPVKPQTMIADPEEFRRLIAARNNFLNFVGHDKIIDLIKTIIIDSEHFAFRSERAEKFIEKVNPLFILTCLDQGVQGAAGEEQYTTLLTQKLEEEVTSLVNIEVSKYTKDFMATEKAELLSETDGEFITHNTFSILGNQADNIVYLRLLTF